MVSRPPSSNGGTRAKPKAKPLTKPPQAVPRMEMGQQLPTDLSSRLNAFAQKVGGFAAAGRKLDIPADTPRRVAAGEMVRRRC